MNEQMKQQIEQLFNNGYCLTFNPMLIKTVWQREHSKVLNFEKANPHQDYVLINKKSPIVLNFCDFHYFSDGTLIHCLAPSAPYKQEKLENIMRLLSFHGYTVKRILAPFTDDERMDYFSLIYYISRAAEEKYTDFSDLEVAKLPDKETFVSSCFANGNILLNACVSELMHPNFWDVAAIFADGRYILPDKYTKQSDFYGTHLQKRFEAKYRERHVLLTPQYVPQDYFDALYEKAKEFDWYISPENMEKKFPPHSKQEIENMNAFIDDLIKNRKCISVIPNNGFSFPLPMNFRYALFDDGKLICSKSVSGTKSQTGPLFVELKESFPNMRFEVETVPDYYISEIYRRLIPLGYSACKAYTDILTQRAEDLIKQSHLSKDEAFECVLRAEGWQGKAEFETELTEAHARHLIKRILRKEELSLRNA